MWTDIYTSSGQVRTYKIAKNRLLKQLATTFIITPLNQSQRCLSITILLLSAEHNAELRKPVSSEMLRRWCI